MADHSKWANKQVTALVELGVNPIDAQRSVKWVLDHLPRDADPATYIFPAHELWQDPASQLAIADARAAWYASEAVPAKYKRLLDSQVTDGRIG